MDIELKVENVLPLAAARPADEENRSRGWKMADAGRRVGFQTSCCMHLHWNLEANQSQQPSIGCLQKPPVSLNVTEHGLQRKPCVLRAVLFLFHFTF